MWGCGRILRRTSPGSSLWDKTIRIRLIRQGVVIHTGELIALKRFKDDVKEVSKGYDCGMQIKGYNEIEQYEIIEAFQEVAVKKKLK